LTRQSMPSQQWCWMKMMTLTTLVPNSVLCDVLKYKEYYRAFKKFIISRNQDSIETT
jgi:hypothetical protein